MLVQLKKRDAVRLADWDIILVNSSAGKDSQAMLDYIVERADAEGVRDRVTVVHCDLGRVEWRGTKELAAEQAAHYGVRFEIVSRPQGDLLDHARARGMWPGPATRYCTSDHKRGQAMKVMTMLVREFCDKHGKQRVRILNCLGMRAEESPSRAKMEAFELNKKATTKTTREVFTWLPIQDWTEVEVWKRIKKSGVRHHYAYDRGMPRLSCCFCIFAPKPALMIAARENPELFEEYLAVEKEIDHKFKADLSLADVKAAMEAGETEGEMDGGWNM